MSKPLSFDSLASRAKIAVIVPATNTVVQPEMEAMRPKGVTNHVSRMLLPPRPYDDMKAYEQALKTALETGVIAGAGFDVLTQEPPKNGNPLLEIKTPNFILTPHVAWASTQAMQFLANQLIDNIEAFVGHKPQHLVT